MQNASQIKSESNHSDTEFDRFMGELSAQVPATKPTPKYHRKIYLQPINTPIGNMVAAVCDDALCLLEFYQRKNLSQQMDSLQKQLQGQLDRATHQLFKQLQQQLDAYFAGELSAFDLPLKMPGTDFQQRAWQALLAIPYGETRSYQYQADAVGKKSAVRAVASANGRNRLSIVVPCHRVIGKNGKLTGYAGGLDRKQFLLDLEAEFLA